MNGALIVDRQRLAGAESDDAYLQTIWEVYFSAWNAQPDNLMQHFSEEQLSLLVYGILDSQVGNGGFLQLLFNGYASYVFGSPLAQSLREWGAVPAADLLESIAERCLAVAGELAGGERTLQALSDSYKAYPDFDAYDAQYCKNSGTPEVRRYVEAHLPVFIDN